METLARHVVENPGFERTLNKLEESFNEAASKLIESLTRFSSSAAINSHMSYLAERLNPNSFYTRDNKALPHLSSAVLS